MELLKLENISFAYDKKNILSDLNLSVNKGEFISLLGSSGCGKTTVLRLISGFLNPQKGNIFIDGQLQNGVLPNKRKVGMVFQDYALFPHLTVEQNLYYGLEIKKDFRKKKEQNHQLVLETARILGIENYLNRLPAELSGGQQQRVALGRSLVLKPEILLMDEPLSSLDANLRLRVREELKEIQQKLRITTVYVTHDQEEALYLSDRIAVMNDGGIVQYDTPQKIYFEPESKFVAEYTGRANFLKLEGKTVLVRPEWITVNDSGDLQAQVMWSQFLGEKTRIGVKAGDDLITIDLPCTQEIPKKGQRIKLKIECKKPIY